MKLTHIVLVTVMASVIALLGCQPKPVLSSRFEDYLKRLSRTLMVESDWPAFTGNDSLQHLQERPNLSSQSERNWAAPVDAKGSLFLFLRVDGCSELKRLLAARNNQIGQHQPLPLRVNHEVTIRALLSDCLAEQAESSNQEVAEMVRLKEATLQSDLWNPIFASSWFTHFAFSNQTIPWSDRDGLTASAQAIEFYAVVVEEVLNNRFTRWSDKKGEYLAWFKKLDRQKTLGQLVVSLIHATHYLNAGTEMIAKVNTSVYCAPGIKRSEHDYFKNVVKNMFVGEIQPYLSHLSREGGRLLIALDRLINAFDQSPGLSLYWETVYRSDDSLWSQFEFAVKNHAMTISKLNEVCGLNLTK